MTDIVPALKSEIAELAADIQANPDPRVRKLQRLREALSEYEPKRNVAQALTNVSQGNGNGSIFESPTLATKSVKMRMHIGKLLKEKGTVHRKDLLESLLAAGIMGKETDPMQALAIYLSSHKNMFESDGSGNFSLREGAELIPR
jgi:hypothetical protein